MKTIFKSYGMKTLEEIKELEKNAKEYLEELNGEAATDSQIQEYISNIDCYDYEDEEVNLKKELNNKIFCIAHLGLWNGRVTAAKVLSNNLKEVLNFFGCDELHVYFDGRNIKSSGIHHDGRNIYEFREIKEGVNIEALINKISKGDNISRSLLNYYTKPLSAYIKEIYGW